MEQRELSKEEIIALIAEFKSEVRKNLAKIDFFNEKIDELTKQLGVQADKKRKPYPLSKWDKIVIEVIRDNGKPVTSKYIYEKAMQKAEAEGIAIDEHKMKARINQCLVKLSGRRNDLKKVKHPGRGFAYDIN